MQKKYIDMLIDQKRVAFLFCQLRWLYKKEFFYKKVDIISLVLTMCICAFGLLSNGNLFYFFFIHPLTKLDFSALSFNFTRVKKDIIWEWNNKLLYWNHVNFFININIKKKKVKAYSAYAPFHSLFFNYILHTIFWKKYLMQIYGKTYFAWGE